MLIVCRCLPLIVNVLHLSLPDKRQVELSVLLERCIVALERVQRIDIKLELVKSYMSMLSECADRAALKIVIVSSRFFTCLLEQLRFTCLLNDGKLISPLASPSGEKVTRMDESEIFLSEFIYTTLSLIKSLLENSQSVKDTFIECNGYNMLYETLKDTDCALDKNIAMLLSEMVIVLGN
jgi:hypothetical protein